MLQDIPFQMYFIGSGYAEKELKELIVSLDLQSKVTFIGSITNRELLKKYYAAADLFLFPSLYDNAPLVVREAAALQTPSVLIDGSTSAEIITDSQNGFLTAHDVDKFADKIRELSYKHDVVRRVGKNASQSIARSWESVTEEVSDRYELLIKRKRK